MTEIVLAVEHLRKSYGPVEAVGDLNFTVRAGETVALLGGNGAGKTTAMSMILGVVTPSAGRVWLFGRDATRDRRHALPRMNFSSPYVDLPHRLSVRQNLDTYARLYGIRRPAQHRVLMMRAGRVVDDGTPAALLARYGRSSLEDVFLDVARAEDA